MSRSRPRLARAGAVECLFKPLSETALLDALNAALSGEVNMTTTLTDSVARRSYM